MEIGIYTAPDSRPLREVVSWNTQNTVDVNHFGSRPLREVVSWNMTIANADCDKIVDLFVRSWVEIRLLLPIPTLTMSTSSWGRELKYKLTELNNWIYERRPLREVVSWNANVVNPMIGVAVDLFVRSWVEIHQLLTIPTLPMMSTSSWGRELKLLIV